LILINLDTSQARLVSIEFDGRVSNGRAQGWLLAADKITDSNEFEEASPKVAVRESVIADFKSGYRLALKPHSMTALRWDVE
jgi:alpha-L-arabinofuranosidase